MAVAPRRWRTVPKLSPRLLAMAVFLMFCALLASLALPLAAAFAAPRGDSGGGRPKTELRLQLKWRHQFQFAGYYAAIEQGYFREEGLEVILLEGRPDFSPTQEVLEGRADFAVDSPAVLLRRSQGDPLVVVAAIFQHSPTGIMVRRDAGLETPQSLAGKRIMLTPHTDPENLAMLVEEGIPLASLDIQPHTWSVDDLAAGRVDGQSAYATNEPYLLRQRGVEPFLIKPVSYGIDFYGDCLVTSEETLQQRPVQVEAFRRAVIRGWRYAMANPDEIAGLIHSRYSQEKTVAQLLFEAEAMRPLIEPELVEVGHVNPERWRRIATTFVKLGMMPEEIDLDGLLYNSYRERRAAEREWRVRAVGALLAAVCAVAVGGGLLLLLFNRRLSAEVRRRTALLAASERHFRAFYEMASVGVAEVEVASGRYLRANGRYCDIVGYSEEELLTMGFADITHPDDLELDRQEVAKLLDGTSREFTIEKRFRRKDGSSVWVYLTVSPLWVEGAAPTTTLGVIRDITSRKEAEEKLVFAAKVFANSIEGIVVTDRDGTILQVNPAFSAITGYRVEEAIGQNPRILKSDKHPPRYYEEMWDQLLADGQWAGEIWNRRKNGEAYPEWLTINAVRDSQGRITNFVSLFHDISELKRQEAALKHQAEHDALTGLPNRVLIGDRLEMALKRIARHGGKVALLYLDLDNFKHINDGFGHHAGDNLLVEIARRLSALVRGGDTVARLGGDEFLVLLGEVDHIEVVGSIAVRILESLRQPFHHGDIEYFVTSSVGITVAPDDGADAATLVKNADIAMYRAKSLGRNGYQFFAPDLDIQAHRRVSLEASMRKGLENDEFLLHFQPLVAARGKRVVGAEALVRWQHQGRLVPPAEFIPLAEESGLILPLGALVLREAVKAARRLEEEGFDLALSINISFRQFVGQDLADLLGQALAESGLAGDRLFFEVTESMVMGDLAQAQGIMGTLRQLGIRFYLDDFGTGHSSLAHLKRLPIDGLKIDRSFIADLEEDADSRAISRMVVSLAESLNLAIVAEGVETDRQRLLLEEMDGRGLMLLQGYLFGRPMPLAELLQRLEADRAGPAPPPGGLPALSTSL